MKKYLFILMAVVLGTTACKEDSVSTTNQESNTSEEVDGMTALTTWGGPSRTYHGAPVYDCFSPPLNCFRTVIVTPGNYANIAACVSGGASAVSTYFNGTGWHSYMPGLLESENAPVLADLQSGDFYFEEEENPTSENKFILVKDVVLEDLEYVFEFDVD